MTEDEAKKALFQIHYEYMRHSKDERSILYNEYQEKRCEIKKELVKYITERKESQLKEN